MSVKRYSVNLSVNRRVEVTESLYGSLVKYHDYAALESRCAELAAENAGLKAALNPEVIPDAAVEAFTETAIMDHDWNETSEWSWVENDTDVIRAVLEAIEPETPATDAFLAEVRASGVEMFADHLSGMNISASETSVREFADQIRKGVQS